MPPGPPMAERALAGRPASPGLAAGPVHRLPAAGGGRVPSGDPAVEAEDLRSAIGHALVAVETLMNEVGGEAADVLGFQAALLSDDELTRPAFAAVADGAPADEAWQAAMASEIAGYLAGEDEYFRARAADLEDLRDRVLDALNGGEAQATPPGAVLVAHDMPPSRFLAVDWSAGGAILLAAGSATSHVAMLARSRGVPMIVGLGFDPDDAQGEALVDGETGRVVMDPDPATVASFESRRAAAERERAAVAAILDKPAVTRDGTRVAVHLNIADPAELKAIDPAHCDGIGLVRTEFLFHGRSGLPGEEAQFGVYRMMAEWAGGRPVTIRTLDAGGDKPIPGLTLEGESNPFLGLRGLRLSLRHPEVFRVQIRALLRASAYGAVKIMLPMVTTPAELAQARGLVGQEHAALQTAGRKLGDPPLGIMVEVPAAAVAVDLFDADFFSIGSNDLTQYVTAAGRDSDAVADLADPLHPAVLRLVAGVARYGREVGRDVSLCGDAGGDPAVIPHLLRAGLRSVSVAPAALGRAKAAIAAVDLGVPA